jgi:hypothetical protein
MELESAKAHSAVMEAYPGAVEAHLELGRLTLEM